MRPCLVRALPLAVLSLTSPAFVGAQLVTPRTVPVHQAEQFRIFPASRAGLGGITIAFDDTLADPFVNPAKSTRHRGVTLTAMPYSHSISNERGGGRTLPIGLLAGSGRWSGAVLGAIQQLERAGPVWNRPTSEQSATNQYVMGAIASRLARGLSIGASAYHADLSAIDGVDLLYGGSDRIQQRGSVTDLRLGATKEWAPGHALELLVLRNRTDMRHDVHFTTTTWNQQTRVLTTTQRDEVNLDQTNVWGVHSEYTRPIGREGWRVGALATANRLSHPKIPNYVLQNIPRDPGDTRSYNVGLGVARTAGPIVFGLDVVLEPISSDTWADSETAIARPDGSVIPAGQKTVENHFVFRNSRARLGIGRTWGSDTSANGTITADFGLAMYAISYDLRQTNNVLRTTRDQHENWVESGPTLGLGYRARDITISYLYRASCGTDGCDFLQGDPVTVAAPGGGDISSGGIIAAPSSPLFFQGGSETSHRITISVPIR